MRLPIAALALALPVAGTLLPAALAAEPWKEVARAPGDIPVELDMNTVFEALDGARLVTRGTFRKQLPTALMETAVAIDCAHKEAKIRGIRLIDGETVLSEKVTLDAEFLPINEGSAEAIYMAALCGGDAAAGDAGE